MLNTKRTYYYPLYQRLLELSSLSIYSILFIYLSSMIIQHITYDNIFYVFGCSIIGYFVADLMSGIVHWIGDTIGTETTPIIGPILIKGFRDHHVKPNAMLEHDFIETNGNSALMTIPFLII